jgi:hypothetical protein
VICAKTSSNLFTVLSYLLNFFSLSFSGKVPSHQVQGAVDAKLVCKHKGLIPDSNVKACQPI